MSYAIVGDDVTITFSAVNSAVNFADHRAYSFSITKDGNAIDCKAFVDPVGFTPQVMANTFKDLTVNFRDDITEEWDQGDNLYVIYTTAGTAVSGWYKVKTVNANTVPVDGIADFSASMRNIPDVSA